MDSQQIYEHGGELVSSLDLQWPHDLPSQHQPAVRLFDEGNVIRRTITHTHRSPKRFVSKDETLLISGRHEAPCICLLLPGEGGREQACAIIITPRRTPHNIGAGLFIIQEQYQSVRIFF